MGITVMSDGGEFVYCVFGADGCECENLEAIFGTELEAISYIADLLSEPMLELSGHFYSENCRFYGRSDLLEVRRLQLGKSTRVNERSEAQQ